MVDKQAFASIKVGVFCTRVAGFVWNQQDLQGGGISPVGSGRYALSQATTASP